MHSNSFESPPVQGVEGLHTSGALTADDWDRLLHRAVHCEPSLLPLPLLARPKEPESSHRRCRQRFHQKLSLYRIAVGMAAGLAHLYAARKKPFPAGAPRSLQDMRPVHREAWIHLLSESKRSERLAGCMRRQAEPPYNRS